MSVKYIIGPYGPIIFDECYTHANMAGGMSIISAGFCFLEDGKFHCYGKSTSLGIASRPEEDSRILNKMFDDG
jgi:hypothetical protein